MNALRDYFTSPYNPYRKVLLAGVLFVIGSLACFFGTGFYAQMQLSSLMMQDPIPDQAWVPVLERSLERTGVNVRHIELDGSNNRRVLNVEIDDKVGNQRPDPYLLVSGVHLMVGAPFFDKPPHPVPLDWVTVYVYAPNKPVYWVKVSYEDIGRVIRGEISEKQYLDRWQPSPSAPDFEIPERHNQVEGATFTAPSTWPFKSKICILLAPITREAGKGKI